MEGMQASGRSKTKPEIRPALSGPASPEKEGAPPLEAATPYPVLLIYPLRTEGPVPQHIKP